MLENIRENSQGVIAKVILGFIILTFAVAGIGSYTNNVDTSVAEVNGEKISQRDFEQAYQAQRSRMAQQFGEMFETLAQNPEYMAQMRTGVLDNLINEKLIVQNAGDLAIRISNDRLKTIIRNMPEFQVNGVFDNNRYLAIINQAGFFQSSDFRDYLRVDIARRQLSQALVGTEFVLPYQEKMLLALQNQQRDLRFATINAEQFKASVEVDDTEINTYYLENQARFENQEKVKVNYVLLDVADIAKSIQVSDNDVDLYYKENIASYRQDEQRRLAHILVEFGNDESAAEQRINELLNRINAGEDFAELAKTESSDTFSGENGGDLDWFEPGINGAPFDEAALSLTEENNISGVVKTSFGFHIIKLTDFVAEKVQPLSEVRDEILVKAKKDKALDKFYELQQELARVSFEFPDSLYDAAQVVNAEVKTSDWFSKMGGESPFDNTNVLDVAFSDLVLNENVNSDIIEVSESIAMVLRVNEYQPANVKPLLEVSDTIKAEIVANKATEQAQKVATELLTAFKTGADITEQLSAVNASFETHTNITRYGAAIDANIARDAFVLPHPQDGIISAATSTLSNGDLAIVEVIAVNTVESGETPNFAQQQTSQLAQAAYQQYLNALKVDAKIKRRNSVVSEATL